MARSRGKTLPSGKRNSGRSWRGLIRCLTVQAVGRLRRAGPIIGGKTNLPVWASDCQSYNELFGTTNNPWDASRTPGGRHGAAGQGRACHRQAPDPADRRSRPLRCRATPAPVPAARPAPSPMTTCACRAGPASGTAPHARPSGPAPSSSPASPATAPGCNPAPPRPAHAADPIGQRIHKPAILTTGCAPPDHLADQAASQSSAGHSCQPLRQPRPAAAALGGTHGCPHAEQGTVRASAGRRDA